MLLRFWEVFPFDFGGSDVDWALVARVMISVAIFGCGVSIIVQIVVLVRAAFRETSGAGGGATDGCLGQDLHHQLKRSRMMDAIVVYESMYGNTRHVAEAIARGIDASGTAATASAGDLVMEPDATSEGVREWWPRSRA